MSRKKIRRTSIKKIVVKPLNAPNGKHMEGNARISTSRTINRPQIPSKKIIVTPELYLSNENFSNALKSNKEKTSFFKELDFYALSEFNKIKDKGLPIVNMVFHGHWGWVFSKMVENYKKHLDSCYIISSVNPIEGCDVYQYWRPAAKYMQAMIRKYQPSHNFLSKGVHMIHDSPHDRFRANTPFRQNSISVFHSILCTSLEQFNYYKKFKKNAKLWYTPLGIGNDIIKKEKINNNSKIRLGFVGRLYSDKIKGEEELIKLAELLSNDKFEFVILSPNAQSYINKLKDELKFKVYTTKDGSFQDMYKKIDVTLILSKHEGTPLPLIESIGLGNYVLANPVGEVPVILKDNHIIKSIKDLTNKLNIIYNDRSILEVFHKKSNELIEGRTVKNFVTQTENIWKIIW
tara:strand:- start:2291 stop:3502 length:1212 start_codon:yes stop_codon:yes gene_type:complete